MLRVWLRIHGPGDFHALRRRSAPVPISQPNRSARIERFPAHASSPLSSTASSPFVGIVPRRMFAQRICPLSLTSPPPQQGDEP